MKKIIFVLSTVMILGCAQNNKVPSDNSEDSTLYQTDESHAVIYNMKTGKNEVIKIASEKEDGTIKVTEDGDTLYWLGGDTFGQGEYISKEKWQKYCKEMDELHKKYE